MHKDHKDQRLDEQCRSNEVELQRQVVNREQRLLGKIDHEDLKSNQNNINEKERQQKEVNNSEKQRTLEKNYLEQAETCAACNFVTSLEQTLEGKQKELIKFDNYKQRQENFESANYNLEQDTSMSQPIHLEIHQQPKKNNSEIQLNIQLKTDIQAQKKDQSLQIDQTKQYHQNTSSIQPTTQFQLQRDKQGSKGEQRKLDGGQQSLKKNQRNQNGEQNRKQEASEKSQLKDKLNQEHKSQQNVKKIHPTYKTQDKQNQKFQNHQKGQLKQCLNSQVIQQGEYQNKHQQNVLEKKEESKNQPILQKADCNINLQTNCQLSHSNQKPLKSPQELEQQRKEKQEFQHRFRYIRQRIEQRQEQKRRMLEKQRRDAQQSRLLNLFFNNHCQVKFKSKTPKNIIAQLSNQTKQFLLKHSWFFNHFFTVSQQWEKIQFFIQEAYCTYYGLSKQSNNHKKLNLQALMSPKFFNLQQLTLRKSNISSIQSLSYLYAPRLRNIDLSQNQIISFQPLNKFKSQYLSSLNIQDNEFSELVLSRLHFGFVSINCSARFYMTPHVDLYISQRQKEMKKKTGAIQDIRFLSKLERNKKETRRNFILDLALKKVKSSKTEVNIHKRGFSLHFVLKVQNNSELKVDRNSSFWVDKFWFKLQ